ncbi:hypothetical protein niasHT_024191 [Heterodera trifolii]|uniref:Uncharacterized protein n=1 Tax=Heterodera trifolii TaxID=157864 RepID=A0ABD2JLV9_9BILA
MCLSRLGQIIYGGLALVTIVLICVSMFTDGWRKLNSSSNTTGTVMDFVDNPTVNMGLMFCRGPTMGVNGSASADGAAVAHNEKELVDVCKEWFLNKPDWEKFVVGAMVVSLVLACLAFIWNLVTFCACFCHSHVMKPLPGLAGLTAMCLAVALTVFYMKNQQYIPMMKEKQFDNTEEFRKFIQKLDNDGNHVGYSFYMGCGAAIVALANSVVGAFMVCLADKYL